jgi:hypothetical protein
MENMHDASEFPKLNRWVNIVISDIERKFTDRTVWTSMHERTFLCVLLR